MKANRAGHVRRLALRAWAASPRGREPQAEAAIRLAVEAARPEQYLGPFLELAIQTRPLLRGLVEPWPDTFLSELINEADWLAHTAPQRMSVMVVEQLTGRERQILHYLPSMLASTPLALGDSRHGRLARQRT